MRKHNCRSRAGAATVEFALVAPILIMFVFWIIEFSRGLMVRQALTNATREGAREASLPDATMSSVKTKVVDFLDSASIDIDASSVTVTPDPEEAINNEQITVSVSKAKTPPVSSAIFGITPSHRRVGIGGRRAASACWRFE
jgi:Flp pilus assembly protein TadG